MWLTDSDPVTDGAGKALRLGDKSDGDHDVHMVQSGAKLLPDHAELEAAFKLVGPVAE